MKLAEIIHLLEEKFPPEYAEGFDNIGLLAGRLNKEITKILICLDCDKYVIAEAASLGAELIITHHPVIFEPIKSLTDLSPGGEMLLSAIEHGISIYSAHTNLDSAPGGLTEYICNKLSFTPIEPLGEKVGRLCRVTPGETIGSICRKIKKELNAEHIFTTGEKNREIKIAAVCNGGGGGLSECAAAKGADVYISGDLKHHEVRQLYLSEQIDFIEVRHHECEFPVCDLLKNVLSEKFGDNVKIYISKENKNPLHSLI